MWVECGGGTPDDPKGCFYFAIQDTLFVNANTSGAAVRFGLNLSRTHTIHNSARIDRLIINNAGTGWSVRLNYILNTDIFTVAVSAGSAGLVMDQVQFSRISGVASATAGIAILIERGYSFGNTIQAIDLEVPQIGLTINSPYANHNSFVSPYLNCPTPIVASGGYGNLLLNPSYVAALPPNMASLTGVVSFP